MTHGNGYSPAKHLLAHHTIQTFLHTTRYVGAAFSSDGLDLLVSSNATGIFNAYAISVKTGDARQLTHSTDERIFTMTWFPTDRRFLYRSDQGGNELMHIYVQDPAGGVQDLTPGTGIKAVFYGWSWDDDSFLIGTNERDRRYFDIYEIAGEGYERRLLFRNEEGHEFAAVSPDRRWLALGRHETNADSDVYLYDREDGSLRCITAHSGEVRHTAQLFDRTARHLLMLTDQDSEFMYLVRHNLADGRREVLLRAEWDVVAARLSRHDRYLAVVLNADASNRMQLYETDGMRPLDVPCLAGSSQSEVTFARDETRLAFYSTSGCIPRDLSVCDLPTGDPRHLTRSLHPSLAAEDLVQGEVVRFTSYDGLVVPGVLYKPQGASARRQVPAIVYVHGGPGGQSQICYDGMLQFFVHHGYLVYAINHRGSSGYGKTYLSLDDRRHGSADLDDCVACKRMLAELGYVDPDRIAIVGGSYGGYMVLAALAFRPAEFAAGVDLFGISNWLRTLQSIPVWWESMRKALEREMGSFDDEVYLRSISPLFHADRIAKPLMVLQGANDPRVLQCESDDIVAAVRERDIPVEYLIFQDEGHGFYNRSNRERGCQAILEFLDRHVKRCDVSGPSGAAGDDSRLSGSH